MVLLGKVKNPNIDTVKNKQYLQIAALAKYTKAEFTEFYIIPETSSVVLLNDDTKNKESVNDIFTFNTDLTPSSFWGCYFTRDNITKINKFFKKSQTEILDSSHFHIEFKGYDKAKELNTVKIPFIFSEHYKYPDFYSNVWRDIDTFNIDDMNYFKHSKSLLKKNKESVMNSIKNKKFVNLETKYGNLCFAYPLLGDPKYILDIDCIPIRLIKKGGARRLRVLFEIQYETGMRHSVIEFLV